MSDTILRQLEDADIVLLNKVDLISRENRKMTLNWLNEIAYKTPVIETNRSVVPPVVLLRDFDRQTKKINTALAPHQPSNFRTSLSVPDMLVDPAEFAERLILENSGLIRAKGFVKALDGTMQTIQIVGKRIEIAKAPDGVETGVVTISIGRQQDDQ